MHTNIWQSLEKQFYRKYQKRNIDKKKQKLRLSISVETVDYMYARIVFLWFLKKVIFLKAKTIEF